MKTEVASIISSLSHVEIPVDELRSLMERLHQNMSLPVQGLDSRRQTERRELGEKLREIRIVLRHGGSRSFGDIIRELETKVPPELLLKVTRENVYKISPFRELGALPIADAHAAYTFNDYWLLFATSGAAVRILREVRDHRYSPTRVTTYRLHAYWNWWEIPFVYSCHQAETKSSIQGWVGTRQTSGEEPFVCRRIETVACGGLSKATDGHCYFRQKVIGSSNNWWPWMGVGDLDPDCQLTIQEFTAGPVQAKKGIWGGTVGGGVCSLHGITISEGDDPQYYVNC